MKSHNKELEFFLFSVETAEPIVREEITDKEVALQALLIYNLLKYILSIS